VVLLQAAALAFLLLPRGGDGAEPRFVPAGPAEIDGLRAALAGVYLTGSQPGHHGLALTTSGELRMFELQAVEAPRLLLAGYTLGRAGGNVCLLTDQPGGRIVQTSPTTLDYCGEVYRRVP
jgi:hypothetical protein